MENHNPDLAGSVSESISIQRKPPARWTPPEPLLTAEDVARRLNVSTDWVWDHSSLRPKDKQVLNWEQLWLILANAGRRDRLLLMLDMTEALRPSELFALRWRSFDDQNTLTLTDTVYRRTLRPFGKTPGSLTKVHLPDGLADELLLWKMECKKNSCKTSVCTKPEHRRASPDEYHLPER